MTEREVLRRRVKGAPVKSDIALAGIWARHYRQDVTALLDTLEAVEKALKELCRGHNARGSDGPCDCVGCRAILEGGER